MTIYVIREKYFGYNDEVFYASGSRISSVFESKEQAETTYKQLEIKAARNFFLYEVESLFDANEALLKQLDDFVFSRCGEHIYQDGGVSRETLPESLNDEDTFEFIQLANMQSYQLIHFDQDIKFYGLWSVKKQQWVEEHDEFFASLVYSQQPEQLKSNVVTIFADYDYGDIQIKGSFEELSDQPALLQAMIHSQSGLKYNQETQTLIIMHGWEEEPLYAVNPLLKQPLFEIKQIALEEIQAIETELSKQYSYEDEYE
ncbi:hypothetical protein [Acinetobacter beijerinckii]|uniref:Uncharacterized protein n=1 Tax=Acinetobacter beijerinckii ANC 3835 TaxID=1217649 RepID=N9FUH1_9GAMM|nr:hypothetical protein [Acinetobacter beijerinckii]ENW08479.1 hypothetical protein F934_00066 [Acinetobacter beijerinckii ANC 3835]